MRTLVESLKRLYDKDPQGVTREKLRSMVSKKTITRAEYKYITREDYE